MVSRIKNIINNAVNEDNQNDSFNECETIENNQDESTIINQLGKRYNPILDLAKPIAEYCLNELDKAVMLEISKELNQEKSAPFLNNLKKIIADNKHQKLMSNDATITGFLISGKP